MSLLKPYLLLGALLFSIGVFGVLSRKSLVGILISLEVMLNAVNLNLVAFSRFSPSYKGEGEIFTLFVIAVAAAEAALALAIILLAYKHYETVDADKINLLKG